ncbi:MAG: hypothetical protein AAGK97_01920, partial [Bacteroidota bacterium]
MKTKLYLPTILLLLFSCKPESNSKYVVIEIHPNFTNQEAIQLLKEEEKQLNRIFNSLQDGLLGFEEVVIAVEEVDE